jgi:hypothetical protein
MNAVEMTPYAMSLPSCFLKRLMTAPSTGVYVSYANLTRQAFMGA